MEAEHSLSLWPHAASLPQPGDSPQQGPSLLTPDGKRIPLCWDRDQASVASSLLDCVTLGQWFSLSELNDTHCRWGEDERTSGSRRRCLAEVAVLPTSGGSGRYTLERYLLERKIHREKER